MLNNEMSKITAALQKAQQQIEERAAKLGIKIILAPIWNELLETINKVVETTILRKTMVRDAKISLYVQQRKYDITFTDNHVFVGCIGHTWEYWYAHCDAIGALYGYTPHEIARTKALFKVVQAQIEDQLNT
jgi:hypothetical protein